MGKGGTVEQSLRIEGVEALSRIRISGFASVYQGYQPSFERWVAVKVLRRRGSDRARSARFERERRMLGQLAGLSGVVRLYGSGILDGGDPYLITEYCPHGSLAGRLATRGPLPVGDVLEIGRRVCAVVTAMHALGMLHRDIKPANILLRGNGEAVLGDFGLVIGEEGRALGEDGLDDGPLEAGRGFTAPEVPMLRRWSEAADVYALGATLSALLGERELSAGKVPAQVPSPVAKLLVRMLAPDPGRRPTAAHITAVLDTAVLVTGDSETGGLLAEGLLTGGLLAEGLLTGGLLTGGLERRAVEPGEPGTDLEGGDLDDGDLDDGVPDAGVPDAGVPDAGVPETGDPETGDPETGDPDAGDLDTGVVDTAVGRAALSLRDPAIPGMSAHPPGAVASNPDDITEEIPLIEVRSPALPWPRSRRRVVGFAVTAVVACAVSSVTLTRVQAWPGPSARPASARGDVTAPQTVVQQASPALVPRPNPATSPPGGGGTTAGFPLPAGFTWVQAAFGLRVAVPSGWTVSPVPDTNELRVRDPRRPTTFLQFGGYRPGHADQLERVREYASGQGAGYTLIHLDRVPYGAASDAADWEYTYTTRTGLRHARGRYWRNGPSEYVVYASSTVSGWAGAAALFDVMLRSARPA